MSEASDAVTRFWFEELDKEVLRAPKAAVNSRSVNFSQRSGMRLIRREKAHYVAGELDSELWEITREEWRAYALTQRSSPVTVLRDFESPRCFLPSKSALRCSVHLHCWS
jgi:hypothetical protein